MSQNEIPSMYGSVVIWGTGKTMLLEKRLDCGWWGLPGGRIEPGEAVSAAAIREVAEETGLKVEVTDLIGVYSNLSGRIVTYPDKGDVV